jgi:transposase-like protein
MKCPECKSDHINKNGHRGQKQNYICLNCGRQFIHSYETKGYSDDVKRSRASILF